MRSSCPKENAAPSTAAIAATSILARRRTASAGADTSIRIRETQATLRAAIFADKGFLIEKQVIHALKSVLGGSPIESGGMFGAKDGVICRYCHDRHTAQDYYVPDVQKLNEVIQRWAREGVEFAGIAHSHPSGCFLLSPADLLYSQTIKEDASELTVLIFAILTIEDGKCDLHFYDCLSGGTEVRPIII